MAACGDRSGDDARGVPPPPMFASRSKALLDFSSDLTMALSTEMALSELLPPSASACNELTRHLAAEKAASRRSALLRARFAASRTAAASREMGVGEDNLSSAFVGLLAFF